MAQARPEPPALRANCPSCGAELLFTSKTSLYSVCRNCRSLVLRKDLDVRKIGEAGELQADASPIQIGTGGHFHGKPFGVIGRIQWRHARGVWNEWYLSLGIDKDAWLGEAQGLYVVTRRLRLDLKVKDLSVGKEVRIEKRTYRVKEIQDVRCVAGEGELPVGFESGYEARVVDLAGPDRTFATIEYSEGGPYVFVGESVDFAGLDLRNLRAVPGWGHAPATALPARSVETFRCPKCAAPLEIRAAHSSVVVVCGHCQSVVDAADEKHELIAQYSKKVKTRQPKIPLGKRGTISGEVVQAIGFATRQIQVEGVAYSWDEYLLYSPFVGYRWLTEYAGHWTWVRPCHGIPIDRKGNAWYGRRTYKHFQTAKAEVVYCVGEFFWQVRRGDTARVSDHVAPPYVLSREAEDKEVTWSLGEYVEPGEVWKAFGLEGQPPARKGVGAAQPSPHRATTRAMNRLSITFLALLVLVQILSGALCRDEQVHVENFSYTAIDAEKSRVSREFELTGRPSNVRIRIEVPALDNAWAYFQIALINAETGDATNVAREVSYYHGVDGGERWSEGGTRDESYLPTVPAGRYYLLIVPDGSLSAFPYTVAVDRDVPRWSWFWLAVLALALPYGVHLIRHLKFEHDRWSESDHPWGGSA